VPKGSSYDQFRSKMLISVCKISRLARIGEHAEFGKIGFNYWTQIHLLLSMGTRILLCDPVAMQVKQNNWK